MSLPGRVHPTMDLTRAKSEGKKWLRRVIIGAILLAIIGPVLYTTATLEFAYSKGERVGFVQKLSKKGWVCKTNEGELAMVNMAGQQAEIFLFTVPDDKLSKEIESYSGHRVELSYEEHKGVPSSCWGDTTYFVVGAKRTD
jgi:hypothetical protein